VGARTALVYVTFGRIVVRSLAVKGFALGMTALKDFFAPNLRYHQSRSAGAS
jgi:hypothetical protein